MWGLGGLSRVEMNAEKEGALDSPSQPEGKSMLHFSFDTADDFIDGYHNLRLRIHQYPRDRFFLFLFLLLI